MTGILHAATMMGSGGLEKWLVDLVAAMSRQPYENHIVVRIRATGPRVARDTSTRLVADSPFSIASNCRVLSTVYASAS